MPEKIYYPRRKAPRLFRVGTVPRINGVPSLSKADAFVHTGLIRRIDPTGTTILRNKTILADTSFVLRLVSANTDSRQRGTSRVLLHSHPSSNFAFGPAGMKPLTF